MTALDYAKAVFMEYLETKTRDLYPEQEWVFYRKLLEFAKNYKPDFSGYIPVEYKIDAEKARKGA
jgi:hypothetical protein